MTGGGAAGGGVAGGGTADGGAGSGTTSTTAAGAAAATSSATPAAGAAVQVAAEAAIPAGVVGEYATPALAALTTAGLTYTSLNHLCSSGNLTSESIVTAIELTGPPVVPLHAGSLVPANSVIGIEWSGCGGEGLVAPVMYDVAIGDSLAAGVGASQPSNDYVDLLYQHELTHYPNLQLLNLSCSGATTTDVLSGSASCSYTTGTQLGDAEAFLRAHPDQIAFLTIDIGFNNVLPCLNFFVMSGIDGTCAQNALNVVSAELPQILSGLRSAYPGLSIYGMDYYDGFLAGWLLGGSDRTLAQQSVPYVVSLNKLLGQIYGAAGALMADPAGPFETKDFSLTGSYLGMTVPQNVALICEWTLMCVEQDSNMHTNDLGYAELADSFEQVIDPRASEVPSDGGNRLDVVHRTAWAVGSGVPGNA